LPTLLTANPFVSRTKESELAAASVSAMFEKQPLYLDVGDAEMAY